MVLYAHTRTTHVRMHIHAYMLNYRNGNAGKFVCFMVATKCMCSVHIAELPVNCRIIHFLTN